MTGFRIFTMTRVIGILRECAASPAVKWSIPSSFITVKSDRKAFRDAGDGV
jgi:hypothetical protein